MRVASALCSSADLALTKRAAAAEISPDMTDRRRASVICGTSRAAMFWPPCSVAENEAIATAAAASVMIDTAANATGSLTLIPKPPSQADSLRHGRRSRAALLPIASATGTSLTVFIAVPAADRPRRIRFGARAHAAADRPGPGGAGSHQFRDTLPSLATALNEPSG